MAKTDNMDMDIIVQASGIETTIAQFTQLTNTIANTTSQIAKLSTRVSTLMRGFSKLSQVNKKANFSSRISSASSIVKSRNNRLNLGDLADFETGRVANTTYTFFNENSAKNIRNATREVSKTTKEVKKLDNSTKKATKSAKNLYNRFKRFASITAIVSGLEYAFNSVVKSSGEWIESLNLFSVTFGDNYKDTLDWALEFADNLGVANQEIVKMAGLFKQLSTSIGLTDEMGDSLSKTLTQLGYDLGSFFNIDFETAFERLQSGIFSGQIRTLRNFGIDISQESLDTFLETNEALRQFSVSSMQLSQSQKVLLRTIVVLQASQNAFGDLARSIDTLQNRTRVFQAALSNLRLAIGDALSDTVSDIVANLTAVVQVMTSVIRLVVPIKEEVDYDLGDNIFTEISDDAEAANESIGLLSFDKFQVLSSSENENLTITEALTAELQKQQEIYEQMSSQFDGIDEQVQSIKNSILAWVFPNTTLKELQDRLEGVTEQGERFDIVLDELNPTLRSIINLFKSFGTFLGEWWKVVQQIAPAILDIANALIQIIEPIVTALAKSDALYIVLGMLLGLKFVGTIGRWVSSLQPLIKIFNKLTTTLSKKGGVLDSLTGFFRSNFGIALSLSSLAFGLVTFISNLDKLGATSKVLIPIIATLAAAITGVAVARAAAAAGLAAPVMAGITAAALAAGLTLAAGTAIALATGFENGGIPAKSELFYMNENGIPEALINTGGTKTNVINIDQLSEGMRRGFVEAIYETGLNKNGNITIKVDGNINNSAVARAIFPALKVESQRRGGNQL